MNSYLHSLKESIKICTYGLIVAILGQYIISNMDLWLRLATNLLNFIPDAISSNKFGYIAFNVFSFGYICVLFAFIIHNEKPNKIDKIFLNAVSPVVIAMIIYTTISSQIPANTNGILAFLMNSFDIFIYFASVIFLIGYAVRILITLFFKEFGEPST